MRGGFLHNSILLNPIETHFLQLGAEVRREHRTESSGFLGFVDLFVLLGVHRLVFEAELSADRVHRDVSKAIQLEATQLLIVVPCSRLVRSIRRRLRPHERTRNGMRVSVLTLGGVLHQVRHQFPLFSSLDPHWKPAQSPWGQNEG